MWQLGGHDPVLWLSGFVGAQSLGEHSPRGLGSYRYCRTFVVQEVFRLVGAQSLGEHSLGSYRYCRTFVVQEVFRLVGAQSLGEYSPRGLGIIRELKE